jgi:hypothetical protein
MALVAAVGVAAGLLVATAAPSSAHVVPTSTVALDVRADEVDAAVSVPLTDLQTASGVDLGDDPTAALPAQAGALQAYVRRHIAVASPDGQAWSVSVGALALGRAQQLGTGPFRTVSVAVRLVPPTTADLRRFTLHYDVVLHQVVTHQVLVSVRHDWASGQVQAARTVGTVDVDPVTGQVRPLTVDLGAGGAWHGFVGMVSMGVRHILEGTDHQLFLLTLLLPAPLLAVGGAWSATTSARQAGWRIARITGAFTLGHSVTLALGTLGLPVPQQLVETLIAVSIVVAAVHAVRPLFPGREAVVAGLFGLVHGMAFSVTLSQLDLSGRELALSLLGFNVGIELMQMAVVVLVLPPLVAMARSASYPTLRVGAAMFTLVAALGWLLDRLGAPNPVAAGADRLVDFGPWLVAALWAATVASLVRQRRHHREVSPPSLGRDQVQVTASEPVQIPR